MFKRIPAAVDGSPTGSGILRLLAVFLGTFIEGEIVLVLGGIAAHRGYLDLPWQESQVQTLHRPPYRNK